MSFNISQSQDDIFFDLTCDWTCDLQELMLLKQSQVLTNLASLDEAEAARAESASLRWQVSSRAFPPCRLLVFFYKCFFLLILFCPVRFQVL